MVMKALDHVDKVIAHFQTVHSLAQVVLHALTTPRSLHSNAKVILGRLLVG